MDHRIEKLAQNLLTHSLKMQSGEKLLIESSGAAPKPLVKALLKAAYEKELEVFYEETDVTLKRIWLLGASEAQMKRQAAWELTRMKEMDGYISIRANDNTAELSDVPTEQMNAYQKIFDPVLRERVDRTRWVVLRYPNPSMAQLANMSSDAFADFYFDVCTMDYDKMEKALLPLKELMEKTDQVHIVAPGTDLTFSIKNMPAVICAGESNIPDGEIYTAPIKDSVQGTITYNTPSTYRGTSFSEVSFTFENGKIVESSANHTDKLIEILDTDEGARFIGEFALGVNPYINNPMNDILFDEKISGSLHFTPGACYDDTDNGNESAVHWDLVLIQRPDYGGGEIYFDDVLIRKDGLFVLPELEGLNPKALKE